MSAKSPYEAAFDHLPEEWGEVPIVELGKVLSGSTPSRDVPTYWGGDIPWVTPGELTGLRSKYISQTIEAITPEGLNGSGANLLPQNSLLITTRATLGSRAINTRPMATNQGFKSIVFKNPTDANYYYHWAEKLVPELTRRASGTTFLEISGSQFCQIRVPNPPESERVKIAQILDTLDAQILQTEALIAKLERIKQGLLTDLLTRGIDQKGQLRPTPDQAPHLYKDSPLGRIPREWGVAHLGAACEEVVDCPHSTPEYLSDGVLVARTMHIKNGEFLVSDASCVSEATYRERIARLEPQPGDVIFTREAPVGEAFVIPEGMRICLGQRVMLLRPKTMRMTGSYLVSHVYSGTVASRIQALTSGTTNPHLNVADVKDFLIPLPSREEQQAVDAQVSGLGCRLRREQDELAKLSSSKNGLMDDLLTGRVRVTPLLEEAHRRKD